MPYSSYSSFFCKHTAMVCVRKDTFIICILKIHEIAYSQIEHEKEEENC